MIYGFVGKKQSGKNLAAKIWQLLDVYYNRTGLKGELIDFVLKYVELDKFNLATSWQQKSFAHSLKQILCILFGCSIEQFESNEFKNSKLPEEWKVYRWKDGGSFNEVFSTREEALKFHGELAPIEEYLPTYRETLQFIGTELFRNQLHPNWAINSLLNEYQRSEGQGGEERWASDGGYYSTSYFPGEYPNWLITDVRFQNEADSIIKRGGKLIKVEKVIKLVYKSETSKHVIVDNHQSETELESIKCNYTISAEKGNIVSIIEQVKEIMIKEGVIKWIRKN